MDTEAVEGLRERKKRRTRRDLSEAALRLFLARGYEATTLDDLVDAAEVSKRTFFRYYPSKEAVALAAESDLWDACIAALDARELNGPVLAALHDVLTATVSGMGDDWLRRFLATRGLLARTPALRDRSDLASLAAHHRIADVLRGKPAVAGCDDRVLALLAELVPLAWRRAAKTWVRSGEPPAGPKTAGLIREIDAAFAALPKAVGLRVGR